MKSNVTEIKEASKPKGMIASLDEFREDLENDKVTDFIIISRCKAPENPEGDGHELKFNWMARDSCIMVLGLLDYMKTKVKDYMWDR